MNRRALGSWWIAAVAAALGTAGAPVSRGADNLPDLKPAVTWIGNTFSGEPLPRYVPLKIEDISVAGDGTVATNGDYNESASAVITFKGGKYLGHTSLHVVGPRGKSTVAEDPDGKYLFYATDHSDAGIGAGRVLSDGSDDPQDPKMSLADAWPAGGLSGEIVTGIAVRDGLLFVSHHSADDQFGLNPTDRHGAFQRFDGLSVIDKSSLKILRSFPLANLGKLAATHGGDVWAIQSDAGAVRVVKLSGKTGQRLAVVEGINAGALAVDAADRLLVADDGPDQNVKIFSQGGKAAGSFGTAGGIFAGPVPGAAGPARFDNPRGIGVDADNNLYVLSVGGTWPAENRIEAYAWRNDNWAEMRWQICGMMFADVAVFDPRDENRLYTSSAVFAMDWSRSDGHEWSFAGTTYNPLRFHDDPRRGILAQGYAARAAIRVEYFQDRRILFSGAMEAFRFDPPGGLIATPADYIAVHSPTFDHAAPDWPSHPYPLEGFVWRDRDGDGAFGPDEYEPFHALAAGVRGMMSVDDKGGIVWLPRESQYKSTELSAEPQLDPKGNLIYHPGEIKSRAMPGGFSEFPCSALDFGTGDLFAIARPAGGEALSLIRVAGWRDHPDDARPTWAVPNIADHVRAEVWAPAERDIGALAVAGDYVFVASAIHNSVRVFRRDNGAGVGWMRSARSNDSTLDDPHVFHVHRRGNGEYVLILGDYLHNKNLVYRWNPPPITPPPPP